MLFTIGVSLANLFNVHILVRHFARRTRGRRAEIDALLLRLPII